MVFALSSTLMLMITLSLLASGLDFPSLLPSEFGNSHTTVGTDSVNATNERGVSKGLPFLPPLQIKGNDPTQQQSSSPSSETGSLAIKKVEVGTSNLLMNANLMITPNPYTLNHSLVVTDDKEADSDPTSGIILLQNVRLGSYIINETKPPPGFGPILLKTRVAVHQTDPNPVVTIENRKLDVLFEGTAIVTPPSLNDSSFKTFVSKGATVGTDVIKEVDALPPGFIGTTETEFKQETKSLQPVTFEDPSSVNVSASEIFRSFKIPTYPAPVKAISSNITYLSPIFIIPQSNERDGTFLLTPIIAKAFPGMSLLVEPNSSMTKDMVQLDKIKLQFANESSNVGFSFGISNTVPKALKLPEPPFMTLKFFDIDFVGAAVGSESRNFSNVKSFLSSPEIIIGVDKSANISRLADGCPDISLFTINESNVKRWQKINDPKREPTQDTSSRCAYILEIDHFSKFSVGGVKPSTSQSLL
jgi:hypothetical protein